MQCVRVGKHEQFNTIASALQSVEDKQCVEIFVENGIYNEKLYIEKEYIKLIGESKENTIITNDDGAYDMHADGTKNGTFRSYTVWISGDKADVQSLTIQNTCGDGEEKGQGIALAVDAKNANIKNVNLYACQDTLFTGPLPLHPRIKDGFKGPSEQKPRASSTQRYTHCTIKGDIDFIFGSANAIFDNCRLIGNDRGKDINGYFVAPSTPKGEKGYVFLDCSFECSRPHSYFLARPWRRYAKAAFVNCVYNNAICHDQFDYWNEANHKDDIEFTQHNCK